MGLFDIFKKKNKQPKTHKVVVDYNEIEKKNLEKDKGINTLLINDIELAIKEDPIFKIKNVYGVIDGVNIKITMPKYMFLDNLVDVKPEYIARIEKITKNFKEKYDLIVERISVETAKYLNSKKIRKEQYSKDEVVQNIKTNNITFALGKDNVFGCWLDDESVLYSEYEDGTYKVEFFNEED